MTKFEYRSLILKETRKQMEGRKRRTIEITPQLVSRSWGEGPVQHLGIQVAGLRRSYSRCYRSGQLFELLGLGVKIC
jgi:hypothetical protein